MKMVQLKQQRQLQAICPWKKMEAEHSGWGKLSTTLEKEFVPKYDTRFHQQDRTQWWEWWWKKEKTEIWRAQSNNNLHFVFSLHLMLGCPQAELLGKNTAYSRNQDTTINSLSTFLKTTIPPLITTSQLQRGKFLIFQLFGKKLLKLITIIHNKLKLLVHRNAPIYNFQMLPNQVTAKLWFTCLAVTVIKRQSFTSLGPSTPNHCIGEIRRYKLELEQRLFAVAYEWNSCLTMGVYGQSGHNILGLFWDPVTPPSGPQTFKVKDWLISVLWIMFVWVSACFNSGKSVNPWFNTDTQDCSRSTSRSTKSH